MSEISEPVNTDEKNLPPNLSHKRILRIMSAVLIISVLISLFYGTRKFTFGLIIGGVSAFANYFWLKASLKNLFEKITSPEDKPRFLAVRYFARYAAIGAVLLIPYLTDTASIVGILLGLSAFAIAVTVEGFIRIFISSDSKKEEL